MQKSIVCPLSVPMEEVVRAFNFVIEKGWVSHSFATYVQFVDMIQSIGILLGYLRVVRPRNRGGSPCVI